MNFPLLHFVTQKDLQVEHTDWCRNEWLCKGGFTVTSQFLMARAVMPPGGGHAFHRHPGRDEVIYILEGQAEQWVGKERRHLHPGEIACIPKNIIHATYNPFPKPLIFLAILAPLEAGEPEMVNESSDEPWRSLHANHAQPFSQHVYEPSVIS